MKEWLKAIIAWMIILIILIIVINLTGCQYSISCLTGDSNTPTLTAPRTVDTSAQGNVPVQGGTVNNPVNN